MFTRMLERTKTRSCVVSPPPPQRPGSDGSNFMHYFKNNPHAESRQNDEEKKTATRDNLIHSSFAHYKTRHICNACIRFMCTHASGHATCALVAHKAQNAVQRVAHLHNRESNIHTCRTFSSHLLLTTYWLRTSACFSVTLTTYNYELYMHTSICISFRSISSMQPTVGPSDHLSSGAAAFCATPC